MATANPYALTDLEPFWADGYQQAQANPSALFGKPPEDLSPDSKDKWKEGWRAGKQDLRDGQSQPDASDSSEQDAAATDAPLASPAGPAGTGGGGREERLWVFTVDGTKYEGVTTEEAGKALDRVATALERRVSYYSGYQETFNQTATSSVVNAILETASGFHYQPSSAVWEELDKEIAAVRAALSAGRIDDAATEAATTSEAVSVAAKAWNDFLDHFYQGGDNTIEALGTVAKVSITAEAVMITVATDGAGNAAIGSAVGGGSSGLTEWVDQWVDINEGKQHAFDWHKIGEDALIGAVLGGASNGLSEHWAELLARYAPSTVGANTALLSRISTSFIDSETGARMTAEALAVKMEPLWGKAVTKLSATVLKTAIHSALSSAIGSGSDADSFAKTLADEISEEAWEFAIEETLKEAGLAME